MPVASLKKPWPFHLAASTMKPLFWTITSADFARSHRWALTAPNKLNQALRKKRSELASGQPQAELSCQRAIQESFDPPKPKERP